MKVSQFNSENLSFQLSANQLVLVKDGLFDQRTARTPLKVLIFSIIISIIFHALLIFLINNNQSQSPHRVSKKPISIKLISEVKKAHIKTIEPAKLKPIVKTKNKLSQSSKSALSVKNKLNQSSIETVNIEALHKSIQNHIFDDTDINIMINQKNNGLKTKETSQQNSVFNSQLRDKIAAIDASKSRKRNIESNQQFYQSNQQFEFQPVGDSEIVRVDGNCYLLQDLTVFGEPGKQWLSQGSCARKKKLKFKISPLSYLNKNKLISE